MIYFALSISTSLLRPLYFDLFVKCGFLIGREVRVEVKFSRSKVGGSKYIQGRTDAYPRKFSPKFLEEISFPKLSRPKICNTNPENQHGNFDRCREIIEKDGYDSACVPDDENITVLHWAALNNRKELAEYYLSAGAVIDAIGGDLKSTPLHWAIRQGMVQNYQPKFDQHFS